LLIFGFSYISVGFLEGFFGGPSQKEKGKRENEEATKTDCILWFPIFLLLANEKGVSP